MLLEGSGRSERAIGGEGRQGRKDEGRREAGAGIGDDVGRRRGRHGPDFDDCAGATTGGGLRGRGGGCGGASSPSPSPQFVSEGVSEGEATSAAEGGRGRAQELLLLHPRLQLQERRTKTRQTTLWQTSHLE